MSIASGAVSKRAFTFFTTAILLFGGLVSFTKLGQLEDPEFTVKTAVVVTPYPGASPEEVELEVTDVLEKAIQERPASGVCKIRLPGEPAIQALGPRTSMVAKSNSEIIPSGSSAGGVCQVLPRSAVVITSPPSPIIQP